ncbi:uncharacterized protein LOC125505016 [Dendroctonus ponderosae]|uniref:uncharacterized protein LOC109533065 n=1 Tax=Dendroctonus ponderosae TaxID=77166 RepID=UPI00203519AA|nr:uncharacterized protein LOC109533065 [Dendroctonus ponderosae]XP_048523893.1 uncharacterized protein LOC125505016 [Dendroctonus ponderosae]
MSNDGSASQSDSSNSSSSQLSFFQDNTLDLSNLDSPDSAFVRSGTVVRRSTSTFRKERIESTSSTEDVIFIIFLFVSFLRSSLDSSLENTDCLKVTNLNEFKAEKTSSPNSSSYFSWIESVNSEYFGSAVSNASTQDADSKVGEWNNFWLNYSSARLRHLSTDQTFSSDGGERTADDQSDQEHKSPGSTQRDVTDKNSVELVMLTVEEIQETLRCSQRITEILRSAMKRSEVDGGSNGSYYSQHLSTKNSVNDEVDVPSGNMANRERSISCIETQPTQRQKQSMKPKQQSSSTSCIEALLNTGVGDIWKRVISKRRDVSSADSKLLQRNSFSEWSSR